MSISYTFKLQVLAHCKAIVQNKTEALQQQLKDLSESAANETKSTAGDKYETARAMLHIEQDQVRRQLAALLEQQTVLNMINPEAESLTAVLGSLLRIDDTYYYLSTGLGKMQVNGNKVIALSLQSPLGNQLKGLKAGDELFMKGKKMIGELF